MHTVAGPIAWIVFSVVVLAMLALDLAVFNRKAHTVHLKEAALWSAVWIALALAFGGGIALFLGTGPALEYYTAWLLEKSLSVDNLFVFVLLFGAFAVPVAQRHRVLFWGVLGALLFRLAFILAGTALLTRFHWMTMVFGGFLLFTAVKLFVRAEPAPDPEHTPAVRAARRFIPTTEGYHGAAFFVREGGRILATPLFVVLVAIEVSDILFAVDSIPAVFGVSRDPFVVYTSNIFAILGLRALYFVVSEALRRLDGLGTGLSLVLAFIGAKMLAAPWMQVPIGTSLLTIASLLALPPSVLWLRRHGLRRALVLIAGVVVIAIGIAMIVLPGPAVLVIPAGLAILATEFEWARALLAASRARLDRALGRN